MSLWVRPAPLAYAGVPLQAELHSLLVVLVHVQRFVAIQMVEEHVEVQIPATVVVLASQLGPLASAVVVDLSVGTPERDLAMSRRGNAHLVLRGEQEHLLHLLDRVRLVRSVLRLLHGSVRPHRQLEVLLSMTLRPNEDVGVQNGVQTLDDLQKHLRDLLRTAPQRQHLLLPRFAHVANETRLADVQIDAACLSHNAATPTLRASLASRRLQPAVGIETGAGRNRVAVALQLVDGARSVRSVLVLAVLVLDVVAATVRVLVEVILVGVGVARVDHRRENAQHFGEGVLVVLTRHVHDIVGKRLGVLRVLLHVLQLVREENADLTQEAVGDGNVRVVRELEVTVVDGLLDHRRLQPEVDACVVSPSCAYADGRCTEEAAPRPCSGWDRPLRICE